LHERFADAARGKSKVHYHRGIETIAYLLDGECAVYYGDDWNIGQWYMPGTRFYLPKDVPHAPYNQARHFANGLWFIHPAAIRMASFCCQSWTSCSPKNNEPRAPQSADIAGSTKLDTERPGPGTPWKVMVATR